MTTITTTCITLDSLLSPEERSVLRAAWRAKHAAKGLSSADCLLYALLRGKAPKAGFTPITNARKLTNGMVAWQGYQAAVADLDNAAMDGRRLHSRLTLLLPGLALERYSELAHVLGSTTTQLRKEA